MLSCMSNGGRFGLAKSVAGMMGACLGNLVLVLLSALGLGLLVSSSDFLFSTIKWVGALYLIYLGVQIIRQPAPPPDIPAQQVQQHQRSLWLSSFFIAISNPKGLIYFGALFPQFIHYEQPLLRQFSVLTVSFLLTDLFWMLVYAAAGQRIMTWLKTPRHQTIFNTLSGLVLIVVGLLLAATGKN